MKRLAVVILAAGQGTRMKSNLAKVLHPLLGRHLIMYPLEAAEALKPDRIVTVIGVQGDQVRQALGRGRVRFAVQKKQLGTAHAVMAAMPELKKFSGDVIVLYGDCPLLGTSTIRALLKKHRNKNADMTLLTARLDDPTGYGRIIKDKAANIIEIVEQKDCSADQRQIKEMNPGVYCYKSEFLNKALPRVKNRNRQKEYYLTDLVHLAVRDGRKVTSLPVDDPREILGVNSHEDLATAGDVLRERINMKHAMSGVTIESPENVYIEPGVKIGKDTVIEPGARLGGDTVIGPRCSIETNARVVDSKLGVGCVIESGSRVEGSMLGRQVIIKTGSVIEHSEVKSGTHIGPMAHLRPGSMIGRNVKIGNFVEIKKARIGDNTNASHLTYIGDAEVGRNVNIGCGFITCNYDGEKKWMTMIEDDVFIGSDSQTVAPVKIGKGAYIGSGSTITEDVPPGALSLTRAPQVSKKGWAKKKKAAKKKNKK